MAYVTNYKVNLGTQYDYDDAVKEVASLVNIGARTDGRIYLADVCKYGNINQWAKYKPLKTGGPSNLSAQERLTACHGLYQNPSTFYMEYDKVTDGYWSRLRDFHGYNHKAVPAIRGKIGASLSTFLDGRPTSITFSPDNLCVAEAEIPLNEMSPFATYDKYYVGIIFLNDTKYGFYHTYDWTLEQIVNHEYTASYDVTLKHDAPYTSDKRTYDIYYCLAPTPNVLFGTVTPSMIGESIFILCLSDSLGHGTTTFYKMTHSRIAMGEPTMYKTRNGDDVTFTGTGFRLTFDWSFDISTKIPMDFRVYVNGKQLGNLSKTFQRKTDGTKYYDITISNGEVYVSGDELRDNNNEVLVVIEAKFSDDTTYREYWRKYYNVTSNSFV